MVIAHCRLELAISQVLNAKINAQGQIATRPHRADALDVLDLAPVLILDDALGAILATQPVIVSEFHTFLARVIGVGKAQQVPGDFARRIIAAVLARQVQAFDA